jgi:hypothetical protein
MHFDSFAQALQACLTAAPESDEQEAALIYCLENAPPELKEKIAQSLAGFHGARQGGHHEDGCGCHHNQEEHALQSLPAAQKK